MEYIIEPLLEKTRSTNSTRDSENRGSSSVSSAQQNNDTAKNVTPENQLIIEQIVPASSSTAPAPQSGELSPTQKAAQQQLGSKRTPFRVHCIDMLRGFTMFAAVGTGARGAAYDTEVANLPKWMCWVPRSLGHAQWAGVAIEDVVIPFFHTTMGTGMGFMLKIGNFRRQSEKNVPGSTDNSFFESEIEPSPNTKEKLAEESRDKTLWRDITRRSVKLWVIGFFLQGQVFLFSFFSGWYLFVNQYFYSEELRNVQLSRIRIPGVLQRYGFVYFLIAALLLGFRGRRRAIIPKSLTEYDDKSNANILTKSFFWLKSCLIAQVQVFWMIWPTWGVVLSLAAICTYFKNTLNDPHSGVPANKIVETYREMYKTDKFSMDHLAGYQLPPKPDFVDSGLPPDTCKARGWVTSDGPDRCNPLATIDRRIFGCNHLYDPVNCFDPESLMTIGTVNLNLMVGLHAGLLVKYAREAKFKNVNTQHFFLILNYILLFVLCFGIWQLALEYEGPMIKQMWTLSFAFGSASLAFFFLTVFYGLNDVFLRKREKAFEDTKAMTLPDDSTNNSQASMNAKIKENLPWYDKTIFFVRDYFFSPCFWLGRNSILCWVLFNKLPDLYFCEWYKSIWDERGNFPLLNPDGSAPYFQICINGVFAYKPWWFSLVSCFVHVTVLALVMRWLYYRGTFIVL